MKKRFLLVFAMLVAVMYTASGQRLSLFEKKKALARYSSDAMDTARVELLLSTAIDYVLKPGELKADMDSANNLIEQAQKIASQISYKLGRAKILLYRATLSRESGERRKGILFVDSALALAKANDFFEVLGHAYNENTHYAEDRGLTTVKDIGQYKIDNYEGARRSFQQANNVEEQGFALKNLADAHGHYFYDYVNAIRYSYEALKLYQSIDYNNLQGVYDLLNINYYIIGDFTSAIKYGLLAVKTAEHTGDTSLQICTIYNRLGMSYYASRADDEMGLHFFMKSYAVATRYKDIPSIAIVGGNVGRICRQMGDAQKGLRFMDQMVKDFPQVMDDPVAAFRTDLTYFQICTKTKDFNKAKVYYEKMAAIRDWALQRFAIDVRLEYAFKTGRTRDMQELLNEYDSERFNQVITHDGKLNRLFYKFRLDSLRGNFKQAIKYLQRGTFLKDSAMNANKLRILDALRIEHEVEKKDEEIKAKAQAILNLQEEAVLHERLIKQEKIIRNGTIAGVAILIVVLVITYSQYQAKRNSNDQLMLKQELLNDKNEELTTLVSEKEWLLKEIHHRVKNNLQTIVSLLESQSQYVHNKEALSAITDSQNRVHAMSIIHQKLFQTQNLAEICVQSYLPELILNLKDSFGIRNIQFNTNIQSLDLDVTQAIPIGLIMNEAVTNCIKYAFPSDKKDPQIWIDLLVDAASKVTLTIRDNGTGLPADFDTESDDCGLGIKLMKGLTADIDGTFNMISHRGLTIEIVFIAIAPLGRGVAA